MIELFPHGFEEHDDTHGVELAAYTDASGEERLWHTFGAATGADVADGWEERWRAFHRPVRIGRLWVGPPWEEPAPGLLAVVIDPGQAFGTGGHATTRLCLDLLCQADRGSVLDVGCGSGVLAIAAALLGFAPVVAVDVDPVAIEAAVRNAAANGVALDARRLDAALAPLPTVAVVVANVSLELVESLLPRVDAPVAVTSGYLERDEPAFGPYRRVARRTLDGWAADLLERAQ